MPGPGDYKIPPKIGDAPKYQMGLKLEKDPVKDQKFQPGPSSYSPIKAQTQLRYTMSGKNEHPIKLAPGPGTYNDMIPLHYSTL